MTGGGTYLGTQPQAIEQIGAPVVVIAPENRATVNRVGAGCKDCNHLTTNGGRCPGMNSATRPVCHGVYDELGAEVIVKGDLAVRFCRNCGHFKMPECPETLVRSIGPDVAELEQTILGCYQRAAAIGGGRDGGLARAGCTEADGTDLGEADSPCTPAAGRRGPLGQG